MPQNLPNSEPFWPTDTLSRVLLALAALAIVYFFGFFEISRGEQYSRSTLEWAYSAWNKETDMEHGVLFPFLTALMLYLRREDILKAYAKPVSKGSYWLGIGLVLVGCLFFLIAYRSIQPRISMGALPIVLSGCTWLIWGWRVALATAFPIYFFWMAVPLPSFQQATVSLQHISTNTAHALSSLCGAATETRGTEIFAADGSWGPLDIAGGCSGIRSLMALLMIAATYAYITPMTWWKKAVIFFSAVPIAIIGNAIRVSSICIMAHYGDAQFAAGTWHDWSGLLLFFPISLSLLVLLHSLLESSTSPLQFLFKRGRGKRAKTTIKQA